MTINQAKLKKLVILLLITNIVTLCVGLIVYPKYRILQSIHVGDLDRGATRWTTVLFNRQAYELRREVSSLKSEINRLEHKISSQKHELSNQKRKAESQAQRKLNEYKNEYITEYYELRKLYLAALEHIQNNTQMYSEEKDERQDMYALKKDIQTLGNILDYCIQQNARYEKSNNHLRAAARRELGAYSPNGEHELLIKVEEIDKEIWEIGRAHV